jgi:hypothetical protein
MAGHRKTLLALDVQRDAVLWQSRPQADGDLLSEIAEVERPKIRIVAVGHHLLERLDQSGRAVQALLKLRRAVAHGVHKLVEARPLQRSLRRFRGKLFAFAFQR